MKKVMGLYFIAVSAALLVPLQLSPPFSRGWITVLLAVAVTLFASESQMTVPGRRPFLLSIGTVFLFLLPGNLVDPALWLLLSGALLGMLPQRKLQRFGYALWITASFLLLLFLLMKPFLLLQAYLQADDISGEIAALLGNLFTRMDFSYTSPFLWLHSPMERLSFSTAPEWSGLYFQLVALLLVLPSMLRSSPRRLVLLLASTISVLILWSGLTFLFQTMLMLVLNDFEIAWSPLFQGLLWLPFLIFGVQVQGKRSVTTQKRRLLSTQPPAMAVWIIGAGLFLLLGSLIYHPTGSEKSGRIMLDESHSNWEWSDTPMDTMRFGSKTTYNYHGLTRLLAGKYQVTVNRSPLTPTLLDDVDILIIKTLTSPLDSLEIEAVRGFVAAGGGLYLISDHTDIFGMSTFSNEIARNFGFEFNADALFDLRTTHDQLWHATSPLPHPTVEGMTTFHYLTGCSIRPLKWLDVPFWGNETGSDLANYSSANFFDDYIPRGEMRYGNMIQMVALRYGRGRVVGFTDSTTYSNFAIFWPDRLQHLFQILHWLNYSDRPGLRFLLFLAGLLLTIMGGVLLWRHKDLLLAVALLAGSLAFGGNRLIRLQSNVALTSPAEIGIDTTLSHVHFPLLNKLETDDPLNYETFFIWLYRTGMIPGLVNSAAINPHEKVRIILNPERELSNAQVDSLNHFLRHGGQLLVIASPGHFSQSINRFLNSHGLSFQNGTRWDVQLRQPERAIPIYARKVVTVSGGEPIHRLEDGTPVSTEITAGEGRLRISGLGDCFCNARLGRYDSIPALLSWEYLQLYWQLLYPLPPKANRTEVRDSSHGIENTHASNLDPGE